MTKCVHVSWRLIEQTVPDLVFSEMKFLEKDNPKVFEEREPKKKKIRRKDRSKAVQDVISAFFKDKRPPLIERDANLQSKTSKTKLKSIVTTENDENFAGKRPESIIEPAELTAKPYLGFGSRGSRPLSTSYHSWSESVRGSSPVPVFLRPIKSIDVGQLRKHARCDGNHNARTETIDMQSKINKPGCVGATMESPAVSPTNQDKNSQQNVEYTVCGKPGLRHNKRRMGSLEGGKEADQAKTGDRAFTLRAEECQTKKLVPKMPYANPATECTNRDSLEQTCKSVQRSSSPLGKLLKECHATLNNAGHAFPIRNSLNQQLCDPANTEDAMVQDLYNYPEYLDQNTEEFEQSCMPYLGADHEFLSEYYSEPRPGELHATTADPEDLALGVNHGYGTPLEGLENDQNFPGLDEVELTLSGTYYNEAGGEEEALPGFWRPHKLY